MRTSKLADVLSLLGAFVVASVVLGLVAAGLFMPAVGATGALASSGVEVFAQLPSEFTTTTPYQQSRLLASNGQLIANLYDENRTVVPLSAVAPIMQKAQIAIEDSRFYEHAGIDTRGTVRAFVANLRNSSSQGGSTITQQFVKLTLQDKALQAGDTETANAVVNKNYMRKLQELKYAIAVEKQMTKDQILEGYLNLSYYGDKAYGVEAASRHYFSKPASKLTLTEAAMLAGLVQSPSSTDPVNYPQAALQRRDVVLARMRTLGIITEKEYADAKAVTLKAMLKPQKDAGSCANAANKEWAYFCDYAYKWLLEQPALGKTVAERKNLINRGGLTIQTTMDPKIVTLAKKAIVKRVPISNSAGVGSAVAMVEPGTGRVVALAQNSTYSVTKSSNWGQTSVNWAVDTRYGGSTGFQYGSAAKPFALATALEEGWPVRSSIVVKSPAIFTRADFPDDCGTNYWKVGGHGGGGSMSLASATTHSINAAFATLVSKLGACRVWATEGRFGVHDANGSPVKRFPSAITLGAQEVSPVTIASAYATIAAEGLYCSPIPVLAVTRPGGKAIAVPKASCKQVTTKDVARGVTMLMQGVLQSGTAAGLGLRGRPAVGKTGTTDDSSETWFVGFTPQLSTAVWVGTPLADRRRNSLERIRLNGHYYSNLFGATIAAPLWKAVMDGALAGEQVERFRLPGSRTVNGVLLRVPDVSGMSTSEARYVLTAAGFAPGIGGREFSNTVPAGRVITTSPRGSAPKHSGVSIIVSKGKNPAAKPTPPPPSPPTVKPSPTPAPTPAPKPTPKPTKPPRRR